MQSIVNIIFFILLYVNLNAQIYFTPETNNLNYVGRMNEEIMSYLDGEEILMYYDCLKMLKEDTNTIIWLEDEYFYKLFDDKNEYSFEIATMKNYDNKSLYILSKDTFEFKLPKPMCLIFILRKFGNFEITIKKFF